MNRIPRLIENKHGLHQRYVVAKTNGEAVDPAAQYFVLRLDDGGTDPCHTEACRAAARAYADAVRPIPHLAKIGEELRNLIDNLEASPASA
jgi:hypothetical protein